MNIELRKSRKEFFLGLSQGNLTSFVVVDLDTGLVVNKNRYQRFLRRITRLESLLKKNLIFSNYVIVLEKGKTLDRYHINVLLEEDLQPDGIYFSFFKKLCISVCSRSKNAIFNCKSFELCKNNCSNYENCTLFCYPKKIDIWDKLKLYMIKEFSDLSNIINEEQIFRFGGDFIDQFRKYKVMQIDHYDQNIEQETEYSFTIDSLEDFQKQQQLEQRLYGFSYDFDDKEKASHNQHYFLKNVDGIYSLVRDEFFLGLQNLLKLNRSNVKFFLILIFKLKKSYILYTLLFNYLRVYLFHTDVLDKDFITLDFEHSFEVLRGVKSDLIRNIIYYVKKTDHQFDDSHIPANINGLVALIERCGYKYSLEGFTIETAERVFIILIQLIEDVLKTKDVIVHCKKELLELKDCGFLSKYDPMYVRPILWINKNDPFVNYTGGFLYNKRYKILNYCSYSVFDKHKFLSTDVFNSLNYLQSIKYGLDSEVYNFLYNNYIKDLEVEYVGWKQKLIEKYDKALSEKISERRVLLRDFKIIGRYLRDYPNGFYFVFFVDFRGRIYAKCDCSPTESKVFRSLLRIKRKGPLNISWLKYSILKAYSKTTRYTIYGSEEKFCWSHHQNWRDNFKNVYNPLEYVNYCLEYERWQDFLKNNECEIFSSDLLVSFDATASGFQIVSMMTGQDTWFQDLNIKPLAEVNRLVMGNFYRAQTVKFFEYMLVNRKEVMNSNLFIDSSDKNNKTFIGDFKEVFIDCFVPIFKEILMKGIYSQTSHSFIKNAAKIFRSNDMLQNDLFKGNESMFLKEVQIFVKENAYFEILRILRAYATLFSQKNQGIHFVFQDLILNQGFFMQYVHKATDRIKVLNLRKKRYEKKTIYKVKGGVSVREMKNALVPNFIHFFDAYIIHCVIFHIIKKFKVRLQESNLQVPIPFFSVHDCFLVSTDLQEDLRKLLLRSIFDLLGSDKKGPFLSIIKVFDSNLRELYAKDEKKLEEITKLFEETSKFVKSRESLDFTFLLEESLVNILFYH